MTNIMSNNIKYIHQDYEKNKDAWNVIFQFSILAR